MNAASARPSEFGTGLRLRIESAAGLEGRRACPSSRDLVRLCTGEPTERPAAEPRLVGRDGPARGAWGAFAA